jgi:CxxH/CxxC protein (TIGR04129 family)
MYVCCAAHAELAIDHFVDTYEEAPDMFKLEEIRKADWQPPSACQFCEERPILVLLQHSQSYLFTAYPQNVDK